MDFFELLVKTILDEKGYWTRQSYKVSLCKSDKKLLGRLTMPRTEIDLLALNQVSNELLIVEVKSYLTSAGVIPKDLSLTFDTPEGPYKLFTCKIYREAVIKQLRKQLISERLINPSTKIKMGLAAGKVYQNDEKSLQNILEERGFLFFGPSEIRDALVSFGSTKYENDPFYLAAKILKDRF